MKAKKTDNAKAAAIVVVLTILTGMINYLPWWSFVVPVLIFGITATSLQWKISGFPIGFLSGFIVWFSINLYLHMISNGLVFNRMGRLFSIPGILVILVSGIIAGLLNGVALYTGVRVIKINIIK
ncbi:hypothetical protein [Chitinophaga tropicalis]|uniref:Uncharacterized protein n=1 Tax=Chitinophaga tropicalis TaxID=2683588 RepID=A0A7K1UAX6_9BACT|nr:hypothetical protein [Chitinophaga tropicalis]MVT11428.1 hypothetical protein [Chitinophaga tropicalis]